MLGKFKYKTANLNPGYLMLMQQGIGYVLNFTRCNKPTDYTGKIPSIIRWAGASVQITPGMGCWAVPRGKRDFFPSLSNTPCAGIPTDLKKTVLDSPPSDDGTAQSIILVTLYHWK